MSTLSTTSIWLQAFRLYTLPLAVSSICLGNFLAFADGYFSVSTLLLTLLTATCLQILSNLANDYGDSKHGADNNERVGFKRAVQSGMLSSSEIKKGIVVFIGLSLFSGILLLISSIKVIGYQSAMVLLFLGLLSIAAAIAYTATKKPYGYKGLGDISVLIFFGLIGVGGSYFVQTGYFSGITIFPALGTGLLCTGVLNINNIRDLEADQKARKQTVALQLGVKKAKLYHWAILLSATACFIIYSINKYSTSLHFLFLLPAILFIINGIGVWQSNEPVKLNPKLKQLVISILIFSVVYGIGNALKF